MEADSKNLLYKTAIYLRLSKDDDDKSESASITTQRSILQDFARANGFTITAEYVDDGYSGTNYDRPEFQRLIRDIEQKKIDCVMTKDLSRLGRNSARTSDLLDEYFPSQGVRYISVIDGYDSHHLTNGIAMSTSFLMTMHEMYARDISCKIRSSFHTKMEKGEYVASFAPYGYQKSQGNKNQLIKDPQTAPIVERMFRMAEDGMTPKQIADTFNREKILTPAMYRCYTHPYIDIDTISKRKSWDSSRICKMLSNRVYLGHTLQGKTTKVSFKSSRTIRKKHRDWIVVENTHEPIVSNEMFENVRRRVSARRTSPTNGFHNIFSGTAVCADCGHSMTTVPTRKKGPSYNLCCGTYKSRGSKECTNHFIDYDLLYDAVQNDIRYWLSLSDKEKADIASELSAQDNEASKTKKISFCDILKAQKRKDEIGELLKNLFEAKINNSISQSIFDAATKQYDTELATIARMLEDSESEADKTVSQDTLYEKFYALLNEVSKCETLTRQLLIRLVERIEVEQGYYEKDENGQKQKRQVVKIRYRFIGYADDTQNIP